MAGFKKYEQLLKRQRGDSSEQFPTTGDLSTDSKDGTVIKEENVIIKDESDTKKKEIYSISNNSMESPKLFLELRGERSLLTVSKSRRVPLTFSCVQSLILKSLIGKKAPLPPVWCNLLRENFVPQVNIIIADGLAVSELTAIFESQDDYGSDHQIQESPRKKRKNNLEEEEEGVVSQEREDDLAVIINRCLPHSSDFFPLKLEVESPIQHCDQPARELFDNIPMSANVVKNVVEGCKSLFEASQQNIVDQVKLKEEAVTIVAKKYEPSEKKHKDKMNRVDLLLSVQEMASYGYPLKLEGTESHYDPEFVPLHENYDKVTEKSPMFGIDCEMCLTTVKNELTRISVVDENFNVIYSSFVKPQNHIVNYLTKYSGVTIDHLLGIETSLQNVQKKLRKILPKDCILVGHSLDHDLGALKLLHPYVIDTSRIYNLSGNKYQSSLKMLTKLFLKKEIQNYTVKGHDPAEDAAASLDLALLKLRNDVNFGDVRMDGTIPVTKDERDRADRSVKVEKIISFYSNKSMTVEYQSNVFKIIKLENCLSAIFTMEKRSGCAFNNLGCDKIKRCENIIEVFEKEATSKTKIVVRYCRISDKKLKKKAKKLELLDRNIKKLYDSLPKKSLLLVLFTARSEPSVPVEKRSKGVLLVDLIGQERRQYNKFMI